MVPYEWKIFRDGIPQGTVFAASRKEAQRIATQTIVAEKSHNVPWTLLSKHSYKVMPKL